MWNELSVDAIIWDWGTGEEQTIKDIQFLKGAEAMGQDRGGAEDCDSIVFAFLVSLWV